MTRQTNADLAFDSLLPIVLHPSQTVAIGRVEMIVPLENVAATFSYAPDALRLEHASADVAGGHASLGAIEYQFVPNATTAGSLRLQNVDPMPLIAAAGLENRVRITARIDGEIPFTIGSGGVRFANGRIAANGPGRLAVKREALTGSVGVGHGRRGATQCGTGFCVSGARKSRVRAAGRHRKQPANGSIGCGVAR